MPESIYQLCGIIQALLSLCVSRHVHPSSRSMLKSTSVSGEIFTLERTDGSQSDTALGTLGTGGKKRRSSLSARVVAIVGIPSRRSRSTSQLSQTGARTHTHLYSNCSCLKTHFFCCSVSLKVVHATYGRWESCFACTDITVDFV